MTMFSLLRSKWRDRVNIMPIDRAIAEAYLAHIAAGDWSCTALLDLVNRLQQAHPGMSQTAAVARAIEIIRREQKG